MGEKTVGRHLAKVRPLCVGNGYAKSSSATLVALPPADIVIPQVNAHLATSGLVKFAKIILYYGKHSGTTMPVNKRQHYVPKYMLKHFSADHDQKQVNLLHLKSRMIVRGASLREQCYRDYFYGKNLQTEHSLSLLEGEQSTLIEKIISEEMIDLFDTPDISLLFSLQRARTLRSDSETSGMINALMKLAMRGSIEDDALRAVKISLTHGPNLNVSTALRMSPMLYDLKPILIVNKTKIPFVLSDSPVVTTNWFCRSRYPEKGPTGFSLSGLQMILPISPALSLALIDSGVYSTEAINHKVILHKSTDAEHLNKLQWLNGLNTIYFPPDTSDHHLLALKAVERADLEVFEFERFEQIKQGNAYQKTNKDEYEEPSEGVASEIVRFAARPLALDIRFSGLRIRPKPKFYDDGTMASPIRDPAWLQIVRDFDKALDAKVVHFGQLADFVDSHSLEPAIGPWRRNNALRAMKARKWV